MAGEVELGLKIIGALFPSKKHYRLFYWSGSAWVMLLEGHPKAINAAQAPYTEKGIPTVVIRWGNAANEKGVVPTAPPTGPSVTVVETPLPDAGAGGGAPLSKNVLLIAGAALAAVVVLFFLFRPGKRALM